MSSQKRQFELPKNIEHYLGALARLYAQNGAKEKLAILANAHVRIHEEWSYDDWNGGTAGHAVFLDVPEVLFLASVERRNDVQVSIRDDLNKLHNVQNEFIDQVFVELEKSPETDWRRESGALLLSNRVVPPAAT